MTFDPKLAPSNKNCTPVMASLALAVAATVTVPETVAPATGEVIDTVSEVVLVLFTVIDTAALVALFPELSTATAVRLCLPFAKVVVFNDCEYGATVTTAPTLEPSTWNCTLATPTLSDAVAVTVIVPETVAPETGELIATVGGAVADGWLLELELITPLHPELIRAKTTTNKHPARLITWVDPANHLRKSIIGILDLAALDSA